MQTQTLDRTAVVEEQSPLEALLERKHKLYQPPKKEGKQWRAVGVMRKKGTKVIACACGVTDPDRCPLVKVVSTLEIVATRIELS